MRTIERLFMLLLLAIVFAGCAGKYDGTLHAHARAGWQAWQEDRRPVLADAEYNKLFIDKRTEFEAAGADDAAADASAWMATRYLPQGLVTARELERDQGEKHAESLR